MRKIIFFLISAIVCSSLAANAQKTNAHSEDPIYIYGKIKDIEPENITRLRVKKCKKCDSLPDEIFKYTNLQELICQNGKLNVLNSQISDLKNLRILNISRNKLVRLPESLGELSELQTLIINRNKIESLPESIGKLHKLELIDAWNNPLYSLPQSIAKLSNTLKVIDIRQVPIRDSELEAMEKLLPKTEIKYTSICECENDR